MRNFLRGIPLHRDEPIRPVFIVGSGRSGNTLLRRVLMAGGQIYIPPETYVLKKIVRSFQWTIGGRWRTQVERVRTRLEGSEDFATFPLQDLEAAAHEALALDRDEQSLAAMLDIFYSSIKHAAGSPAERWGDKTPLNAFALPELHAVFPRAQFVHMLRDGYDVIDSYLRMGRYASIEEAARRWLDATGACIEFERSHPEFLRTVRYEDLVTDPEKTLEGLCAWLDLSFNPADLSSSVSADALGDVAAHAHHAKATGPIGTSSIGEGRDRLGDSGVMRAAKLIDRQMAALGYRSESSPSVAPES